jgi:glutamate synthase domain-containing protein 2
MARICHTNGCPVGVTSQKEELRKKFPGTPDNVATFFQVCCCFQGQNLKVKCIARLAAAVQTYAYMLMLLCLISAQPIVTA